MADADEYASVARGKLKLKTDSSHISKKKKKHKKKEQEKIERGAQEELESIKSTNDERTAKTLQLTKAEQAFRNTQERTVEHYLNFALRIF